jgi:hypothetical protein
LARVSSWTAEAFRESTTVLTSPSESRTDIASKFIPNPVMLTLLGTKKQAIENPMLFVLKNMS